MAGNAEVPKYLEEAAGEALAIPMGLDMARSAGLDGFILESGCKEVVDLI